jgi:hypothetical protein
MFNFFFVQFIIIWIPILFDNGRIGHFLHSRNNMNQLCHKKKYFSQKRHLPVVEHNHNHCRTNYCRTSHQYPKSQLISINNNFYVPYILAYKSRNLGQNLISKTAIRLIRGSWFEQYSEVPNERNETKLCLSLTIT